MLRGILLKKEEEKEEEERNFNESEEQTAYRDKLIVECGTANIEKMLDSKLKYEKFENLIERMETLEQQVSELEDVLAQPCQTSPCTSHTLSIILQHLDLGKETIAEP